jgi:phosphoglycerate dehydrogenase-like enzyme
MEALKILVLSNPVTDALNGDGAGAPVCRERFPQLDWRFRSFFDYTEEDVLDADVITGHPRPQWLKNAKKLRWLHLQSAGVNGYETSDIYASSDVIVTRAAGVHAPAMAEHALGMALSLTRMLPELYKNQQAGTWKTVRARKELHDADVLMLGTGYLAGAITPLVKAFGCRITGIRRDTGKPLPPDYDRMLPPEKLHEALSQADYIFSTLPLTEKTRHMLDRAAFAAVKPGAILVNIGRGGTIDHEALLEALEDGRLAGAGLDVTEPEPLPEGHPLWKAPNIIITPHCSAWSEATDRRRYEVFLRNLELFLKGEPMPGRIDFDAGY